MTTEVSNDTHYEAVLDDEPDNMRAPVYVDVVSRDDARRPIVPAQYRPANLKSTTKRAAGRNAHRVGYHTPRLFLRYLPLGAIYAVVGLFRLIGRQLHWWWVSEQDFIRQEAATANDPLVWMKLHREAKATRLFRGIVIGLEWIGVLVAVLVLAHMPLWIRLVVGVPCAMMLARYGRPATSPIVTPAVVAPRHRVINSDVVLRAYYVSKLGNPDKPGQQVTFGSRMDRDGGGGQVLVDLPYGMTFLDAMKARPQLASGMDVTENQVFLYRDKTSTRRHKLYVADEDPLSIPAGRSPLLTCKPTDIWKPAPFGLDERGSKVNVPLMWNSFLVGAQPRKGKTFSTRLLALYGALDPYVHLIVVDGKNSADWKDFRLVAHRFISGTHPNALTADPIEELLAALREIKAHIQEVNQILAGLPASVCPEGKLTRDLSRTHPKLRVWLLVLEEFQVYYETDDQNVNKEIASLLSFIQAVGPSSGVIPLSSSQKPSGIGAGDVGRLFNRYRDNHTVRFALKCGSRQVSEAILGTEAYGEGFDAASLPSGPEYRGVGLLYGLTDATPTVRTHLATGEDAEKILRAARSHREQLGTLTGFAADEDVAREFRDVLNDVRNVFWAGEVWVSWATLAGRMAETMPEHYADINQAAISAQVRGLGATSKDGWEGGRTLKGLRLEDLHQVIKRREIEAKP